MKQIPENKTREERIANEVTVDAYGSEEVMVGWLTYLQDNLAGPFEAECIEEMKISPLRKGEKITVLELIDADENLGGDFFVLIEWMGRKMGVPLAQLKPLKSSKETRQAIEDWQYWKARGYLF
ncbi:MAG TPA: calcium-binding protein [Anaerolineales bacterium]|nr:calcium-binding protein [Anaerolineales bacterium]